MSALVSMLVVGMAVVEGLVLMEELAASALEVAGELVVESIAVIIWGTPTVCVCV